MPRTNKRGIARSKSLKQKNRVIKNGGGEYYRKISQMPLSELMSGGLVTTIENRFGRIYHWFKRGRKACYETGLTLDPDGCDRFKHSQLFDGSYSNNGTSWRRKKLRRVMRRGARVV